MAKPIMKLRRQMVFQPGLIVLRLKAEVGAATSQFRPLIPKDQQDAITLVTNPLAEGDRLQKAGDCFVLRCTRPATLSIEVTPRDSSGKIEGQLSVEYLTEAQPKPAGTSAKGVRPESDDMILAHISRQGDRWFKLGEWVAGQNQSQHIEAVLLRPDHPQLATLRLRDTTTGKLASLGQGIGQRGKNQPLKGLDISLADPETPLRLQAEAVFRKAGHMRQDGARISLTATDPEDALIAFKLSVLAPEKVRVSEKEITPHARVKIYRS